MRGSGPGKRRRLRILSGINPRKVEQRGESSFLFEGQAAQGQEGM